MCERFTRPLNHLPGLYDPDQSRATAVGKRESNMRTTENSPMDAAKFFRGNQRVDCQPEMRTSAAVLLKQPPTGSATTGQRISWWSKARHDPMPICGSSRLPMRRQRDHLVAGKILYRLVGPMDRRSRRQKREHQSEINADLLFFPEVAAGISVYCYHNRACSSKSQPLKERDFLYSWIASACRNLRKHFDRRPAH